MADPFPLVELPLIDLTVRFFTQPRLEGDQALLRRIANQEALDKNERLYALGVGERDLASAEKFKAILEAEGVEVAMKPGKPAKDGTPHFIPALAKSDPFMQELLNHDDERIRDLAQARLDVKSTIDETRSGRIGGMAGRGKLTVYLNYCGAHTKRWSGGDSLNFQNLGRSSQLRRAIRAPECYLLARPDQSQGECRFLNWFAGQQDVVERFQLGLDPYVPMAEALKSTRQFGKVVELACGFGMGRERLASHIKAQGLAFEPGFSERAVGAYRVTHREVVSLWKEAGDILRELEAGRHYQWRILNIRNHRIYHPNGTWLDYSKLKWEDGEWRLYGRHGSWAKMYGAKLVENVIQWLSRIKTGEAMVEYARIGYPVVGSDHDGVWLLIDEELDIEAVRARVAGIMAETPAWAPGLPLAASCAIGETYAG